MFGYYLPTPLPDSPVVTGRGTLVAESMGVRTMSWAFPRVKRLCLVEAITVITAPLLPALDVPRTFVPDWTRRKDTQVERMRRWEGEPKGWLAKYFVTARLLD
jgi:hypothetical protein